jgi:flagellar hook-associated protein 2
MSVSQISGLVSGLDTAALIDALVAARSGPITHLRRRQAEKTAELTAWQSFEAVLLSLKIETERIGQPAVWDGLLVAPSDEDHFTATADAGATLGTWDFHVEQLATAHQLQSDTYSSRDELVGTGTFSLTIDGQQRDLTIGAGTTVADLARQINDADRGVTAALVRSETGGTASYHIVVTAT